MDAGGVQDGEEGEVPQVGAVGDPSDVAEDRVADGAREKAPLVGDDAEDDDRHPDGDGQVAASVEPGPRRARRDVRPQVGEGTDGTEARHLERDLGRRRRQLPRLDGDEGRGPPAAVRPRCLGHRGCLGQGAPTLGPQGHGHSQGRPDQEVLRTGVGALVDPHDRGRAVIEEGHVGRRGQRPDDGADEQGHEPARRAQPATEAQEHEDHRWPHDVELLLDRQRPHVLEGRGLGRLGEVVRPGQDEVPVGHVEQRRQGVETKPGELARRRQEPGVEGHPDQQDEEGRQQAAGPAGPEAAQGDAEGPPPLPHQQRRDEEPREDEEDVHPEEAAGEDGQAAVVAHHPEDGDRTQALEPGDEAEADRPAAPRPAGCGRLPPGPPGRHAG